MVTATMNQYLFVVLLISNLNSQCASSQEIVVKTNHHDSNGRIESQHQSRKLTDEVEVITHSNLISDDSVVSKVAKPKSDIHALDVDTKEYQYFNDASAVSTPKYESNYDPTKYESPTQKFDTRPHESIIYEAQKSYQASSYDTSKFIPPHPPTGEMPTNYKLDESDMTPLYYAQQFEPMAYIPSDAYIANRQVQIIPSIAHEMVPIPSVPTISQVEPVHSGPGHHVMKVTHSRPVWAPEVQKLENQYLETYRTIKSSVLNFYNKMQYILNYFMSLFTFAGELK